MMNELRPTQSGLNRRYRVVSATVRGSAHERSGSPCQDAHMISELPDGTVIMAVADGAGSASLGQLGATIAAQIAVSALNARLQDAFPTGREAWRDALVSAAARAHTAIVGTAVASGLPPGDLATTLILAVVGRRGVALLQIGDGGVVADQGDGRLVAVLTPERGEYANETVFLTTSDYFDRPQTVFLSNEPAALAVFSDGVQRLGLHVVTWTPHGPFFDPLFRDVGAATDDRTSEDRLREFLASPSVRQRSDDDSTLVLLVRQPRTETAPSSASQTATPVAEAPDSVMTIPEPDAVNACSGPGSWTRPANCPPVRHEQAVDHRRLDRTPDSPGVGEGARSRTVGEAAPSPVLSRSTTRDKLRDRCLQLARVRMILARMVPGKR